VRLSVRGEVVGALFPLAVAGFGRSVVRDGGGGEDEVGAAVRQRRGVHLLGRGHVHARDAGRRRQRGGPGDERHIGAAAGGGPGEREPHRPGRAVREEADRVDGLARGAGRDEDAPPCERAGLRQPVGDVGEDLLRLREPPVPDEPAGEGAVGRGEHLGAVGAEGGEVALGRRVGPHVVVHRRADEHRAAARERDGREHGVAHARGQLGEGRRRRRGHHEEVGPEAEVDVLRPRAPPRGALGVLGEELDEHLPLGEGAQRERRDEPGGVRRHEHLHLGAGLFEEPDELRRLVRRDGAGDAEEDLA